MMFNFKIAIATKFDLNRGDGQMPIEIKKITCWCKIILCNLFFITIILGSLDSVYAQDNLREVPNPDPTFELETLNVAEGFEVNLFAAEPMLVKPIQMNWDEKGRLWVVGSKYYPQLKPGEVPNDKIYVLEDTTGDGRADVSTIFVDGLHIPTGILPGDGGVYVANATEILHLKDTNGDGKADQKRRVLSGFGTGDTHHLIHTFRWGPAGRFYFNQSIYIHSRIETLHGIKELEGGGVWRFQPERMQLDIYLRGLINPWGLRFDKWGNSFLTDGAGREGINYAFPGATFVSAPGAERTVEGLNPGQPKHSGLEIISGRHMPASWQGSLITNDYRANRINRFVIEEQGSGYVSKQVEDLLWSDNVAFRPVDISVGPDGAIYVADWYNPIIQHGEVDFRDPRRDHQHGRIWRITAKERPLVEKPLLNSANTDQLLDALKKPERWTRSQAKRLLKERGAEVIVPDLKTWVSNLAPTDPDYEHHLLEALWVFQSVDEINKPLLRKVLNAQNPQARAAAVRVLNYWYHKIDDGFKLLQDAINDEHPKVRLEAVIALRYEKTAKAASTALTTLESRMDRFLDFALWQTVRELEPYWIDKIAVDAIFFDTPKQAAYALKSVTHPKAVSALLRLYQQNKVPQVYHKDVFNSVAKWGSTNDLDILMDLAMNENEIHTKRRHSYLAALEEAARQQNKKPSRNLGKIIRFTEADNQQVKQSAIKLIGYWHLKQYRNNLESLIQEGDQETKQAALDALTLLGDEESKKILIELSSQNQSSELRLMAVRRLISLDIKKAADIAFNILQEITDKDVVSDIFSAFFAQSEGPATLADKLSGQQLPQKIAQQGRVAMQQQIPFHRRGDEDIERLQNILEEMGGELPPERMSQQLSTTEMNRLELDVKASADPQKGEKIYRQLNCMSCHAIGGAGGTIGSDLSSVGANAPTDYIIQSILNPSEDIKDGYELNRIVKKDGSVITGYIARETSSEVIIQDVAGREIFVPQSQIEIHETVPGSLMPPGLTASLERKEFIDLIGFLSKLGEQGEFQVQNTKWVRRWRVLGNNERIVKKISENGLDYIVYPASEISWKPAYSKVAGDLPLQELPVLDLDSEQKYSFTQFEIEVLEAGNVAMSFNLTSNISVWIDKKPVNFTKEGIVADLSRGIHSFTLAINREVHNNGSLRIKLQEASNSITKVNLIMEN